MQPLDGPHGYYLAIVCRRSPLRCTYIFQMGGALWEEKVDPGLRRDDGLGIGLLSPSHADRTRIRN